MDPNETLRRLRAHMKNATEGNVLTVHETTEVGELFEALDEWLVSGGFPPSDWYDDSL